MRLLLKGSISFCNTTLQRTVPIHIGETIYSLKPKWAVIAELQPPRDRRRNRRRRQAFSTVDFLLQTMLLHFHKELRRIYNGSTSFSFFLMHALTKMQWSTSRTAVPWIRFRPISPIPSTYFPSLSSLAADWVPADALGVA